MLTYKYTARNKSNGEKVNSVIQAESEQEASKKLVDLGLTPIEVSLGDTAGDNPITRFRNRVPIKERILFSRQLATLINAGLPLVQSLRSVSKQTHNKTFQLAVNQIIGDIEGGSTLSASMAKHPRIFNSIYISLVSAGETSGTLDQALERVSLQQEKDAEILSRVRGAMTYPIIVLIVMMAVVGFMIVKVLPQVEVLYEGMPGARLPFITVALLAVSHFVTKFWWLLLGLGVVGAFFTTRWARTLGGKRFIDKFKMRAWPIAPLFMKMYMARFARAGTTLVATGVPLIQTLQISSDAINNIHIQESLSRAIEQVKAGKALSESIRNDPNFLELVPDMLSVGEQSGSMETMMAKVAEYYEKEVDQQIKNLSTIIEPLLMIIMGVMAFIIVAAVLLPIYGLAGQNFIR